MKDMVTIIERWYCNRVERYVVMRDGGLMPLEVWRSDPFVLVNFANMEPREDGAVGSAED